MLWAYETSDLFQLRIFTLYVPQPKNLILRLKSGKNDQ